MFVSFLRPILLLLVVLQLFVPVRMAVAEKPLEIAVALAPLSLPLHLAKEQGFFVKEGVSVKLRYVASGDEAMNKMLAEEADLATVTETKVMLKSHEAGDFKILATIGKSNRGIALVAGPDSDIESLRDLSGKRLGVMPGTASHYYIDTIMLTEDIDRSEVMEIELVPQTAFRKLERGNVDAVVIWEPHAQALVKSVPGARIIDIPGIYFRTYNIVARQDVIDTRSEDLVAILHALVDAEKLIRTRPDKARVLFRDYLGMTQSRADELFPYYHYNLELSQSLLLALESVARWARIRGLVDANSSPPEFLQYLHTMPLAQVKPGSMLIVE